jgi:peptidoglycan/xylan/chitin deacetylase (PgdA/CDA1 family)
MGEVRVALTFDAEHPSRAHSSPGTVDRILATLAGAEVRATFFVQGRWATAYPGPARAIAEGGHLVGNHSHYHARYTGLSPRGVLDDLSMAEEAVRTVTGAEVRPWFRFPFGDGDGEAALAELLASAGYRHVGWHVDPNDWDEGRSAADVQRLVLDGVAAAGDGAIVLLHGWPTSTARALPAILEGLAEAEARLVTVDELIRTALDLGPAG